MRATSLERVHERGRHRDQIGAGQRQQADAFGKLDVVADQEPDADAVELDHLGQSGAGMEHAAIQVTEQMALAVVREAAAVAIDQLHGVVDRIVCAALGVAEQQRDAVVAARSLRRARAPGHLPARRGARLAPGQCCSRRGTSRDRSAGGRRDRRLPGPLPRAGRDCGRRSRPRPDPDRSRSASSSPVPLATSSVVRPAHVSLCDQAPSSFGRSPNRAIRPNTRIATSTNTTATAAMTGV